MTKLDLVCTLLVAVSAFAQTQDSGVQLKGPGMRFEEQSFVTSRSSDPQNAPTGQRLSVSVSESGANYPNASRVTVHIGIEVFRDKHAVCRERHTACPDC